MDFEEAHTDVHPAESAAPPTQPSADPSDDATHARGRGGWTWLRRLFARRSAAPGQIDQAIVEAALPAAQRLTHSQRLGEGGMATVDEVVDRALRRNIAMKILRPHLQGDPRAVQSFLREAQINGQLDHPNIAPIYDLGKTPDERLFFTMKLLGGRTLAQIVRDLPAGPLDRATLFDLLEVVLRVCDALAFAHQRGILHRDVKPANVMVGEFGQVYLVDWGIARSSRQTDTGAGEPDPVATDYDRVWGDAIVGTPAYMSPEQAVGGDLDERADLFSLGAMLYFVLARRPPYEGSTVQEVVRCARKGESPALQEIVPAEAVPRELARIVTRALAPLPEDRYQTVSELKQDLVAFMRGGGQPKIDFEPGQEIIREGEVGNDAYIIVAGRCEVFKVLDGERVSIRTIGPGESFGEMAILSSSLRTASVVALERTTVEKLTREELLEELDVMRPWVSVLLRSLTERFRDLESAEPRSG